MTCTKCKIQTALPKEVTHLYRKEPFQNGQCLTPPMGWNSWNYFKENINEKMLLEMAKAIKESGLLEAGYNYLNLDDYWEADQRTKEGLLESDVVRFPFGMRHLVDQANALGFKVGIYSSNGTQTCQSLPGSLGKEYLDARQFVKWGIEYLKYDYCYHKVSTNKGPHLFGIAVTKLGEDTEVEIPAKQASLSGTAKLCYGSTNVNLACNYHKIYKKEYIKGLDKYQGMATFLFDAPEDGDYVITLRTRFRFLSSLIPGEIMAAVVVNDDAPYILEPGKMRKPCAVAPYRLTAKLHKGKNFIKIFNPIGNRADSAILNYMCMSNALIDAKNDIEKETGKPQKTLAFSVCEWGRNKPWQWGAQVANLWRTTGDINWSWKSICRLYEKNVVLYPYASVGHWNDPDMLEVGNGTLTIAENRSHFSLWCMMASPLLLGNDVTNMKQEHLDILKNKNLIAIDQDALGKQAKRIQKGSCDTLVRPLADGSVAVCFFNKSNAEKSFAFSIDDLAGEEYVQEVFTKKESYDFCELWSEEKGSGKTLQGKLEPHGVKVYKIFG